jgi:hypothetical protein
LRALLGGGGLRLHGLVECRLGSEEVSVFGEALPVLGDGRPLPAALAEEEFLVNQVEGGFGIEANLRVSLQVGFRGNALAGPPALALIDAQQRRHLWRR